MKEGKPILEAKEYVEGRGRIKARRKEENWCNHVNLYSRGFYCVRSPGQAPYKEPCTKDDYSDCPFSKKSPE